MTNVQVLDGDLTTSVLDAALSERAVAWDIETSGLDWRTDRIGTCQIAFSNTIAVVVLDGCSSPSNLRALLEADNVRKVFHHAPFDLRFMAASWKCDIRNVACTKVASKILDPHLAGPEHSLRPVLARHLGVEISKAEQVSDWTRGVLTQAQMNYAASDVAYLLALYQRLTDGCSRMGLLGLLEASYAYLPTRVALDIRGSGDVFQY